MNAPMAANRGPLPERKAAMQNPVAEVRVKDRSWITPVFRVPTVRPLDGLVLPALHNPNLLYGPAYLLKGSKVVLTERHAKVRREGYRQTPDRQTSPS